MPRILIIDESRVRAAELCTGPDLAALQQTRQCGTFCGSCLPELKRISKSP